jgi:hypothetical protein
VWNWWWFSRKRTLCVSGDVGGDEVFCLTEMEAKVEN